MIKGLCEKCSLTENCEHYKEINRQDIYDEVVDKTPLHSFVDVTALDSKTKDIRHSISKPKSAMPAIHTVAECDFFKEGDVEGDADAD